MKKILFFIGLVAITVGGIIVGLTIFDRAKDDSPKITIVTTLFPWYDFAKNIGQERVEVSLLLPPGVEAHGFEPKPSDLVKIYEADIFIYTGNFMEPWAEDIIQGISGGKLEIIDASARIAVITSATHGEDEAVSAIDSHIWLDFDNAGKIVEQITQSLREKDPVNGAYYQSNARKYREKLIKLDDEYRTVLADCQSREIVYGGHYTFGYLARRYGLNYTAAQGLAPDSEPTANDLIKLVEQIKKDNIKYVFYEELSSSKIAETLSEETGAQLLELTGAHNLSKKDYKDNMDFLSLMKSNLKNISQGLFCHESF